MARLRISDADISGLLAQVEDALDYRLPTEKITAAANRPPWQGAVSRPGNYAVIFQKVLHAQSPGKIG